MFPIEAFRDTLAKAVAIFEQHAIRFHLTGGITSVSLINLMTNSMSNSRPPCPRSVLVVSWILILLSLTLALLGVRSLWLLSKLPDPSVLPKDALVDLGIGLFSTLLTLSCGIFMLRGYNWARWIYTGWSFLGLVLSLVPEPWGMTFPPGRIVFLFVVGFLFSKPANEFFSRKVHEPEVTDD